MHSIFFLHDNFLVKLSYVLVLDLLVVDQRVLVLLLGGLRLLLVLAGPLLAAEAPHAPADQDQDQQDDGEEARDHRPA